MPIYCVGSANSANLKKLLSQQNHAVIPIIHAVIPIMKPRSNTDYETCIEDMLN